MTTRKKNMLAGTAFLAAFLLVPSGGEGSFGSLEGNALDRTPEQQELPAGVTAEKISMGEELFPTEGCTTCHGADGSGIPGMTGSFGDDEWKFAEGGAYEEILGVITSGLTPDKTGGMPMPAISTRSLTEEQAQGLAAYVWSMANTSS